MKTCPYCAEEIKDEAIKCRYCGSDVRVAPSPAPVTTASPVSTPPHGLSPVTQPSVDPSPWQPSASSAAPSPAMADQSTAPAPAPRRVGEGAMRFSHSGVRYLLGYGADYFGIWDRETPGGPVRRFARTDEGWREAWTAYTSMEPRFVPVTG